MTQSHYKRLIGKVASFAAAYALVLNLVLSSMLMASLSPAAFAAGTEICVASAVYGVAHQAGDPDGTDKSGVAPVHCQLCMAATLAGTPPPSANYLIARNAIAIAPIPVLARIIAAGPDTSAHSPRAPPHSV